MKSIKDVAKLAGVGIGTVSRVTNNSGYVAEKTRKKVQEAIAQLGYEPNEMAKGLLANKSKIIALILPTIHHPLFSKIAFHIEQTLNCYSYKLLLCNSNFEVDKELEYLNLLNKKIIDGIIFISNSNIDDYISEDLPIVTIDRHLSNEAVYISSDNYYGGVLAAKHLTERSCKNIAFLGGFPKVKTDVHKRKAGFIDTLKSFGINYYVFEEEAIIEDIEGYLNKFWQKYNFVDGVFTVTDIMAYQLIKFLKIKNISIPTQIKVIGYDGIDLFGYCNEELTTIQQPISEMGKVAAISIINLVEQSEFENQIILPVTLKIGETT